MVNILYTMYAIQEQVVMYWRKNIHELNCFFGIRCSQKNYFVKVKTVTIKCFDDLLF